MPFNNKYAVLFVGTCATALVSSGYYFWHKHKIVNSLNINCSSVFELTHIKPDFEVKSVMSVVLTNDEKGQVDISGVIKTPEGVQHISRSIHFDYELRTPEEIALWDMKYIKNSRDTAKDEIFKNYLFYIQSGNERFMKIRPFNNGYLIENRHSPVFMCVNKTV